MFGRIAIALVLLVSVRTATAQSAKVIKVQGRKAIVQTSPGTELKVGQTLSAEGSNSPEFNHSSSASNMNTVNGNRDHSMGGSAEFSSFSNSRSGSSTTVSNFEVSGRFGWNQRDMEFGPLVGIANSNAAGVTATALMVGGFFDYNFVPNAPGTNLVYGVGGTASFGTASSGGSSGTAWELFGAGVLKWFPILMPVALRADAGFSYGSSSAGGGSTTSTGIKILAGFDIYF